jgi:hypothetical protein
MANLTEHKIIISPQVISAYTVKDAGPRGQVLEDRFLAICVLIEGLAINFRPLLNLAGARAK